MWTMEQLVQRVETALAAEYPGAPNGRVRELPDRRSIRWYTTIGLVDRPLGTRGRVALYGPRHLLQLVAIKRRQAAGHTLAEIQAELTGATEEQLSAAARVPSELLDTDPPPPVEPARADFWRSVPARPSPATGSPPRAPGSTRAALEAAHRSAQLGRSPRPATGPDLTGIPLGLGVILLIPHPLHDLDRGDLAEAAQPLLDLLASRGLTDGRDS
ncbi:MerR family transcriptional regulator [Actinoplanes sp. NPDC051861]|uniref:MerR family transcriptional regulator n=1 Tax=Actinoplanes sp. NPDC051861 TaxID=3155170 RepID=UPI003446ACDF